MLGKATLVIRSDSTDRKKRKAARAQAHSIQQKRLGFLPEGRILKPAYLSSNQAEKQPPETLRKHF